MIDTSVLAAGLVANHEHHDLAAPRVEAAADGGRVPGIVLAETFARLRGFPFGLDVLTVTRLLAPWSAPERVAATPARAYASALAAAPELNLGGNVHDLLVVLTCAHHELPLVTLDRRQHRLAVPYLATAELLGPP